MNVLITHECSGAVREAFRALGHNAWSCDLKSSADDSPYHIQGDAIDVMSNYGPMSSGYLRRDGGSWHLIGMHPDCTFLTVAGIHWNNRGRGWDRTNKALQHVKDCMQAATNSGARWYLENPISIISSKIRKPDQIIQPYQFGEDASKNTCLWLHSLPLLPIDRSDYFPPRMVCKCGAVYQYGIQTCPCCGETDACAKPRWSNQTNSGQNKLGPSPTRAADRAATYPGIARAMARTWGAL